MNIDFSKKPEGATHFIRLEHGVLDSWWKVSSERSGPPAFVFSPVDSTWIGISHVPSDVMPIPDSKPWNGIGIPPVDTVCQYQHTHHAGAWYDGTILYISNEYTIVKGHPVGEQHYYTRNLTFRPIPTPEKIATEERTRAIDELVKVTCINRGEAGRIYDAGYRKQVQP